MSDMSLADYPFVSAVTSLRKFRLRKNQTLFGAYSAYQSDEP